MGITYKKIQEIQNPYTNFLKKLHELHKVGDKKSVEGELAKSEDIMVQTLMDLQAHGATDRFHTALTKQSIALKMLNADNALDKKISGFHIRRITHANTDRMMRDLQPGVNRNTVFRPSKVTDQSRVTDTLIERKVSVTRGAPKKTIFSKKTPVTAASEPSNIQLFGYLPGVAMVIDLDLCWIKPDHIFDVNMKTNDKWHLENAEGHQDVLQDIQGHKASTLEKIKKEQKNDFEAKIQSRQNEILPGIPLIAVVGFMAITREKFINEKEQKVFLLANCLVGDRMNALYANFMLRELAYERYPDLLPLWKDFPTYIMDTVRGPIKYELHEQLQDINEALINKNRIVAKKTVDNIKKQFKTDIYSPAIKMLFALREDAPDTKLINNRDLIKATLSDDLDFNYFTDNQKKIIIYHFNMWTLGLSKADIIKFVKSANLITFASQKEKHLYQIIIQLSFCLDSNQFLQFIYEENILRNLLSKKNYNETVVDFIGDFLKYVELHKENKKTQDTFDALMQIPACSDADEPNTNFLGLLLANKSLTYLHKISQSSLLEAITKSRMTTLSSPMLEIVIGRLEDNKTDDLFALLKKMNPFSDEGIKEDIADTLNFLSLRFSFIQIKTLIDNSLLFKNISDLSATKLNSLFILLSHYFFSPQVLDLIQRGNSMSLILNKEMGESEDDRATRIQQLLFIILKASNWSSTPEDLANVDNSLLAKMEYLHNGQMYKISMLGYFILKHKKENEALCLSLIEKVSPETLFEIFQNLCFIRDSRIPFVFLKKISERLLKPDQLNEFLKLFLSLIKITLNPEPEHKEIKPQIFYGFYGPRFFNQEKKNNSDESKPSDEMKNIKFRR